MNRINTIELLRTEGFGHIYKNILGNGKFYYVDNSISNASDNTSSGRSWNAPFASIKYALTKCRQNKCDVILVGPNHVEEITGQDPLDFNVAGLTVLGIKSGNLKPKLKFTAQASRVKVSKDNILIDGIDFYSNVSDTGGVSQGLYISGCYNVNVQNCRFTGYDTNKYFSTCISLELAIDILIKKCKIEGFASAVKGIEIGVGTAEILVDECDVIGIFSTTAISTRSAISTSYMEIRKSLISNRINGGSAGNCISGPSMSGCLLVTECFIYSGTGNQYPVSGRCALIKCEGAEVSTYGTGAVLANQANFAS